MYQARKYSLLYYYFRFTGNEGLPDILHDSAGDPLSPKSSNNRMVKPMFVSQKNNRKDAGTSGGLKVGMEAVRMSMLNGSSLGSSYDRSHITGSVSLRDKTLQLEWNLRNNIGILEIIFSYAFAVFIFMAFL